MYTAGWSVDTPFRITSKDDMGIPMTTGNLHSRKADEGVPVLLLFWAKVLSTNKFMYRSQWFGNTRDDDKDKN